VSKIEADADRDLSELVEFFRESRTLGRGNGCSFGHIVWAHKCILDAYLP
jgi:hypothetical protein